ncbi:DUF4397 domain-containing protein [Pedobacter sp. BMA]|uniref:DUF4397 domain-containing protein n=1 Tax=Pedobacter sp. BMA TaxID=1663685 RepID=UPI00064AEEF0|nr:DUF4397 domain-containing protein [Pedobacter sp. BMA]KLT63959.1 hypothetical protein AB669_19755 [Pedobacter sp. BMA]
MKSYIIYISIITALFLQGCKKDGPTFTPLASLNVADAVVAGKNVKLNSNVRDSATLYGYKLFQVLAGETQIMLYPTNNPGKPYYQQTHATVNGGIYSLFLVGPATSPEGIFVKDEIPPYSQDSILRVRVVNCSLNSEPLNVTLGSSTGVNLFNNIAYKSVTSFGDIDLKTRLAAGGNVFQVRNAAGTILTSYTLPATGTISVASSRFKNITLVVKGLFGVTSGSDAFGIYAMANY